MSKPKETSVIKYFKKSIGIVDFNKCIKEDGILLEEDMRTIYIGEISLNPIICSLLSKYLATSYAYYDKHANKIYPHYDFKVHRYYLHYDSLKYGWRIRLIGRIKENYTNTSIEIKLKPFKKFLRRMNKNINLNLEE